MRIIKFRTWSKVAQQIISWEELKPKLVKIMDNSEYPLMQFTGLLDRSGVEIYEGDIIRWLYPLKSKEDYAKNPYKQKIVKWGKESCSFNISTIDNEYEVIGNIYENPKLLKGELNG